MENLRTPTLLDTNENFERNHAYAKLVDQALHHEHAYYVLDKPEISDLEYDKLLAELKRMEQESGSAFACSPTQRVGGKPLIGFTHDAHSTPMLSIDNIYNIEDLYKQLKTLRNGTTQMVATARAIWAAEPKIDGMSLDLYYRSGVLHQATTRGNGVLGDVVTENAKTINSIPLVFQNKLANDTIADMHIRGEVYMTFKDFDLVNKERAAAGLELLSNPRNAASGAMKSLSQADCRAKHLSFMPYHLIDGKTDGTTTQKAVTSQLFKDMGFKDIGTQVFETDDELVDYVCKFEALKAHLPYPVDGLVIKLNHREARSNFPDGTKSVRWAYAYKYAAEEAITKVNTVGFQVGRTGVVTPVANLEPVELDGSVISRATLNNREFMAKWDLKTGDLVKIRKAGMVIPEIVGVHSRATQGMHFAFPGFCPSCSQPLTQRVLEASEGPGVATVCTYDDCPDQFLARLEHWCSKECMDIQDLGPTLLEMLHDAGLVEEIWHLYALTTQSMMGIAGFGNQRRANIVKAIEDSREQGMERVFAGLGIPYCGSGTSKKLGLKFKNLMEIFQDGSDLSFLGDIKVGAIRSWIKKQKNNALLWKLVDFKVSLVSKTYNPEAAKGKLSGTKFVFTGTLGSMDRPAAQAKVRALGGDVAGSVSKKTTHVVAGVEAGSKLDKAKELGLKILTEDEFLKLIEDGD